MEKFGCECDFTKCEHFNTVDYKIILSIDSSYYGGVFDKIIEHLGNNDQLHAYLGFHVFGEKEGRYPISVCGKQEGEYFIRGNDVSMEVKGNPTVYNHKVHPLNHLYWQNSTIIKRGDIKVIAAVERRAKFDHSHYILVH